jgi:hypothetical protein
MELATAPAEKCSFYVRWMAESVETAGWEASTRGFINASFTG